jgi:hypothetical protein
VVALCAAPVVAAQATGDSVTGSASDCLEPFIDDLCPRNITVQFDAHSGPSGENPTGTAGFRALIGSNTFVEDRGPVSCLAVSGKTAVIGYSSGPNARNLIRVTDGGSAPGQDSWEFVLQFGQALPPPDCSVFPPPDAGEASFHISGVNRAGDLVVTDAQPVPTSKDQCTNGGWRNYPGFKNQGDCASFVATGGKNPPAGN